MADNELQPVPPISVIVGDLTVATSGVANFSIEKPFHIQIGAIRIEFIFEKYEEGKADFERKALPESLSYQYIVKGKLPDSPFALGLRYPDNIGIASGYPIWFTFSLSGLGTDNKGVSLQYTVYRGERQPPRQVPGKEAGNV